MTEPIRVRRAPPPLRRAEVVSVRARSPLFRRFTFAGPELIGLGEATPAASVRLLVPDDDGSIVLPQWNGNEYLHADGSRPPLRTLTPLRIDPGRGEVEVDVLLHGSGPMASWAQAADIGDAVAVSGTGRGYAIDTSAPDHLLAGDASALPAITTILAALPPTTSAARVLIEIDPSGRETDPGGPSDLTTSWIDPKASAPGDALVAAVETTPIAETTRVWAAGEAAAVQRIRRHLFDTIGHPRTQCTVRGYWKHGRAGDAEP